MPQYDFWDSLRRAEFNVRIQGESRLPSKKDQSRKQARKKMAQASRRRNRGR